MVMPNKAIENDQFQITDRWLSSFPQNWAFETDEPDIWGEGSLEIDSGIPHVWDREHLSFLCQHAARSDN